MKYFLLLSILSLTLLGAGCQNNGEILGETTTEQVISEPQDPEPAPLILDILNITDGAEIHTKEIEIKGKVSDSVATVEINGHQAGIADTGDFGMIVPLQIGSNNIRLIATKDEQEVDKTVTVLANYEEEKPAVKAVAEPVTPAPQPAPKPTPQPAPKPEPKPEPKKDSQVEIEKCKTESRQLNAFFLEEGEKTMAEKKLEFFEDVPPYNESRQECREDICGDQGCSPALSEHVSNCADRPMREAELNWTVWENSYRNSLEEKADELYEMSYEGCLNRITL